MHDSTQIPIAHKIGRNANSVVLSFWIRTLLFAALAGALPRFVVAEQSQVTFEPRSIGAGPLGEPWITNVNVTDLDQDGLEDVLVCDGRLNKVSWIQQKASGAFEETDIGLGLPGPVYTETVDLTGDGKLDVLVACMGMVVPNNGRIGSVYLLENSGEGTFEPHVLLESVPRVTYVSAGDLNADGKLDLVVGMFGFFDGEIRWLENLGNLKFESHPLLDLSGTIHAPLCDIDNDGDLDIVALVSQDWEEIHVFENNGQGEFAGRVAYGALNKNFGSSGLSVADMDGDGYIDILYTNGDGLDYATPGPRSWHGVQWLRNDGAGNFEYNRIADLPGAHSPISADVNADGLMDIVVVSAFNDWTKKDSASLVAYIQTPERSFAAQILGYQPTHQVSVDSGDIDGDGKPEFVTCAFMYYPPFDHPSRVTLWNHAE